MPEPDKSNLVPYAVFADGGIALIDNIITDVEIEVQEVKKLYNFFFLKPYTKIRIEHHPKESDETFQNSGNHMGFWKRKYPKEWCKPLSLSTRSQVWLIFADWKGERFIDLFKGEHTRLLDKLKTYEKENSGLRKEKNSLQYEFIKMSRSPLEYSFKSQERIQKILKASTIMQVVGTEQNKHQGGEYGGE